MTRTSLILLLIFGPYAALMLGVAWLAWSRFFRSEHSRDDSNTREAGGEL